MIPIGAAADRLGVNPSALRYYEERGLVRPAARVGGRRMYGRAELRRLSFLLAAQDMGMSLDDIAELLDGSGDEWRGVLRRHIAVLRERIARAEEAVEFLGHAVRCPSDDPLRDCPHLTGLLDARAGNTGGVGHRASGVSG